MKPLARLWSRFVANKPEARAGFYGGPSFSMGTGSPTTAWQAENLSGVYACVQAIGSGLASLPATVYRQQDGGRQEAPNHPVARLVRRPNDRQTWPEFIEWLVASALLHGNALAVVEYDGAGRPTALVPVPWPSISVQLLPSGRLAFDVVSYSTPFGGTGTPRRFLDDEVLHLKDRSDDGFLGRSRLSRAPDVLASAVGLQTYAAAVWGNAATPSGIVTVPPGVDTDGLKRMMAHFDERHVGAANARRVFFADQDTKFVPMSVSPEDAEVLASRRFTTEELCRLFSVPPPIVQDYSHSTFTNSAQANRWFASHSLQPWARKIESTFARSVFGDSSGAYHLEFDFSALTRGDFETRWAANVAAVAAGILTKDEVREAEGYPPLAAAPGATPHQADPVGQVEGQRPDNTPNSL
jgi:HK97 family phage portal protein